MHPPPHTDVLSESEIMSLESFPQTPEYQKLKSALDGYAKNKLREAGKKALKEPPRLIYKGTASRRTNRAAEFVMHVGDDKVESCFGRIPRDGVSVTVFGMNGKKEAFRVTKDTNGRGYVFTGDLSIIDGNEKIDSDGIELWGYPDQKLSVSVLTVGVIRR